MQNSESLRRAKYDKAMSIYFDGNAAKNLQISDFPYEAGSAAPELEPKRHEPVRRPKRKVTDPGREERIRRRARKAQKQAAKVERQKNVLATTGVLMCVSLFVVYMIVTISITAKRAELTNEIARLEAQLAEISAQNDSKQYEIDSAVNLSEIITTATEKLGMIRGTSSQIVTYRASDAEYIQYVAEIPD